MGRASWRRATDLALLFALVFLMAHEVTGNAVHEVLGLGMGALLGGHLALNMGWFRRRWAANLLGAANAGIVLSLLAGLAVILGSGAWISTVLPWADGGEAWTARELHVAAGSWFLLLGALHLGIHWKRALPGTLRGSWGRPHRWRSWALWAAGFVVLAAGMTEFVTGDLPPRLAMQDLFGEFVPGESPLRSLLRPASVLGAFAVLGHLGTAWLRRREGRGVAGPDAGASGYDWKPRRAI